MVGESTERVEDCDVCIMGAGVAGLNALFVVSQYLTQQQRVILVDSRAQIGGMWVDTYSYVRLHQPHPLFTAGNIAWTLDREPEYLPTRDEVLDHFAHCMTVIRERVRVDEYLGWTLESHQPAGGGQRIVCRSADGTTMTIQAKRLIKASGAAVTPNDPLPLSSTQVRSVSPDSCDMGSGEIAADNAPVWVIGGGKTAMDTAHALVTAYPGRDVHLVAGEGTFFLSRERMLPVGARRWWTGYPMSGVGYRPARRFDGTNEDEVLSWFRSKYGTWLTPDTGKFLLGVLSEVENQTIATGLASTTLGYLEDVVDDDGGPQVVFRDGERRPTPPGSWFVNCTGYLFHGQIPAYEPYASPDGTMISLNQRSAPLHLPSFIAYFLTHLFMLGKITEVPLYALDTRELNGKSNAAAACTMFPLIQHNMSLIFDAVPTKVFTDCGLDFDRWFPGGCPGSRRS